MRAIKTTTVSILAIGLLAGPAVGVAAQDELNMEAAVVTGRAAFFDDVSEGTQSSTDGIVKVEDDVHTHIWSASDPRLSGDVSGENLKGVIFPSAMPPTPEPYAAE